MKIYTVQVTEDELVAIGLCQDSVQSSGCKAYAQDVKDVGKFLIRCRTDGVLFDPRALLKLCWKLIESGDLTSDGFKAIRELVKEVNHLESNNP